ncbi:MAG: hypothetical protein Q9161_003628 [Pseudevernia consocians]
MHSIMCFPNEILEGIIDVVAPNDLDNLVMSCKRLKAIASRRRLPQHVVNKGFFTRIENNWGNFTHSGFQGLLKTFLDVPSMADYVKEMVVNPWKVRWDEHTGGLYPDLMMTAFEEAVKDSRSIPFEEKEHWISKVKAGNQNPVIALLFSRLHHVTYLKVVLDSMEDIFMFKILQRIVKDPRSPSLSRLREVEILGNFFPTHTSGLITACAALPSVVSLIAHQLVEGPPDTAKSPYEPVSRSSSVRDLEISDCRFSADTLFNLIRSTKSLRSFTYTYTGEGTHPSFSWVRAALLQFARTSLEELTLLRSHSDPDWYKMECSFKSYSNLRVLTIDYGLLMADKFQATNKIVTLLPASLEILNLYACNINSFTWFQEFVTWVVRVKGRLIPCLQELNFMQTTCLHCCTEDQIEELCARAAKAGFEMTVDHDGNTDGTYSWY